MRRILVLLLILALLAVPVSARSSITSAQSQTLVSANGSCRITVTFTIQLDAPDPDLSFPLPTTARDISVNGSPARSSRDDQARRVDLSSAVAGAGTYTVSITYSLPDVVTADKNDNLSLNLQLLGGFGYSIDAFSFSVTLPGPVDTVPSFTSTYYQEAVASVMDYSMENGVLTGSFLARLQDHETVTMVLPVDAELFPQSMAKRFHIDTIDLMMIVVAVIALIYWLVALRCGMPRKLRSPMPPEGITAGEIGCQLTGRGADLSLMVLSWAQMGYVLIHLEDSGRVLLHKRMEMGNERSQFENQIFRSLFGRRMVLDGTGYHYARLCRKVQLKCPGIRDYFRKSSGNPGIFRVLMALIGTLSGVSLACAFAADTFWRVLLGILLGALGTAIAWLLQRGACRIHSHDKLELWVSILAAALWLLLSIGAGEWNVAICVLPAQFLAGLAAGYGGRRSGIGMQAMAEILGLRRYLKNLSGEELKRLLRLNPNYYYDMAPYALALGVDRAFAKQMDKRKLPVCTWLTTGMDGHLTAREWNKLLRDTVTALDAVQKRLPWERLLGK